MNKIVWSFSGEEATLGEALKCVPKGWHALVEELIEDLFALGWDGKLSQIKEKFGGLRFYTATENPAIIDRLGEARDMSYVTCQVTGGLGKLRTDLSWRVVLCDEEYDKRCHKHSEEKTYE